MTPQQKLLREWGGYVWQAAHSGALTGKPCQIRTIIPIAGPRAGALEIFTAGLDAGKLMAKLSRNDHAILRQFVPWAFAGDPICYMSGRAVRLEAGWSDHLAKTMIRLSSLGQRQARTGRWIVGKNERGQTVTTGLSDQTANWLVSGQTGSGKSVALRSAVLQLSRDPANRLVLIDGKFGESLNIVSRLRGVVGPVATSIADVRAALGWAYVQMRHRYETGQRDGLVVIVFDEFQELAQQDDVIANLMRKLTAQGRAAGVHLLLSTQHPAIDSFGSSTTRRNLTGKLALKVADPDASRVAVGGATPRADHLLGTGDCYAVGPRAVHRVQTAYVDGRDVEKAEKGEWEIETWNTFEPLDVGQELPEQSSCGWRYSGPELAVSVVSASRNEEGRPLLVRRLQQAGLGKPGSTRAARLLKLGRATWKWLVENGRPELNGYECLVENGRPELNGDD